MSKQSIVVASKEFKEQEMRVMRENQKFQNNNVQKRLTNQTRS